MYKIVLINNNIETAINVPIASEDAPHLLKANDTKKAGEVYSLTFTIPYNNPGYNLIFDFLTSIIVTNDNTGEVEFKGRIILSTEIIQDGRAYKEVECESELGYLNDSIVRAWDIVEMSCHDFMQKVIDNHNAHAMSDKQFALGNVDVPGTITCSTQFENSLNCLIDKMVNTLYIGYLYVRTENNIRYLDYLRQLPGQSDDIVINKNMKDYNFSKDFTNKATRVIVSGKNNLTIESVNGGKDYLENTNAVNEGYGYIEQYKQFSDIDDPNILLQKAQELLQHITTPVYKLTNNILDLSTLGIDPHGFHEGNDTTVKVPIINFNETFPILQIDKDLLNPQNTQITLDNKFENLTDRQVALQRAAQYINNVLTEDKKLNGFYLRGYVDLLKTKMGAMADVAEKQQAKAILFEDKIPNSPTYGAMALGTQGFMIASEIINGEWDWKTFGTGKGFTADLLIAGTILADMIRGGTLSSLNGKFKIELNDDGKMTTYGTDNGYKALEFQNRTLTFFDFLNSAQVIGQIEVERETDGNGNNTGIPRLAIGIKQGSKFTVSDMDSPGTKAILVIDNNASDGSKKTGVLYLDAFTITNANETGGVRIGSGTDDAVTVYGKANLNGWPLTNIGGMNMSTGPGTSEDGVNQWFQINNIKVTFTNGVCTKIEQIA